MPKGVSAPTKRPLRIDAEERDALGGRILGEQPEPDHAGRHPPHARRPGDGGIEARVEVEKLLEGLALQVSLARHRKVSGVQPHAVLDHLLVKAGGQRDEEDHQEDGEDGGSHREAGAPWISPDVPPGQP
jgi:hypothetical protein